jgi:deazaflavin-dependent oxidoreductase (nitroreductase family)
MSLRRRLFVLSLQIHQAVYERTDGLIGHDLMGRKTLLLRTKGRRSGKPRTSALVYAKDGERLLVVPSKGGAPRAPAWFHNLKADPAPIVQLGRKRFAASAEVVGHDHPDFDRLWKIADDNNGGTYTSYQRATTREIPVVALTLADG